MNNFNWDKAFLVDFDPETALSTKAEISRKTLSMMKDMYLDVEAAEKILENDDPIVYEWYEMGCPERSGDVLFGTTVLYPGKVGNEYFMTKGHFHTITDTAEVYWTLDGEGYMVMENKAGDTIELPLKRGEVCYVPRGYAHRSVNTGDKPLRMFFAFDADAGHDYGTIETKGYHKLIVEKDGKPVVVDNPKWK